MIDPTFPLDMTATTIINLGERLTTEQQTFISRVFHTLILWGAINADSLITQAGNGGLTLSEAYGLKKKDLDSLMD